MTGVADFARYARERAQAADAPAPDCIAFDEVGEELGIFVIDYVIDGSHHSFEVIAASEGDAVAHVAAIRATAVVGGQLIARGETGL